MILLSDLFPHALVVEDTRTALVITLDNLHRTRRHRCRMLRTLHSIHACFEAVCGRTLIPAMRVVYEVLIKDECRRLNRASRYKSRRLSQLKDLLESLKLIVLYVPKEGISL